MPTFAYEKRLSRIETLRLAITYITFMDDLISGIGVEPNFDRHQGEKEHSNDQELSYDNYVHN